MALVPLSGSPMNPANEQNLSFFNDIENFSQRGTQMTEIFEQGTQFLQTQYEVLQAEAASIGQSFSDLINRISAAEKKEEENKNLHQDKMKQAEEKLSALCIRLDNLQNPLDKAEKDILESKIKGNEIRLDIQKLKQKNEMDESRLAKFKNTHEAAHFAVKDQIQTVANRQTELMKRSDNVVEQLKVIKEKEPKIRADLDAIEKKFNEHTHTISYRAFGSWTGSGTGRSNK